MIKKIRDFSPEELNSLNHHTWEAISFNNEIYRVEVLASNKPLIKGINPVFSSLCVYRDSDYESPDSLPIYKEVFKAPITTAQVLEAIESVKKYPGTYIGSSENLN